MSNEIKRKDYCGPAGKGEVNTWLSKRIPDTVFGVYLGECCKEHDISWREHGPNKAGDIQFKKCIRCEMKKVFNSRFKVDLLANIFYVSARIGNAERKLRKLIVRRK